MKKWLANRFAAWLNREPPGHGEAVPLTDMERLAEEVRPGDVILVEGRSRLSEIIKTIAASSWTHAALYIGRLDEIRDEEMRARIETHHAGEPHEQLIIEALLGEGTVVKPLSRYRGFHLRVCRPKGLSRTDRLQVIAHAAGQLGYDYDIRHLFDLARFLLPFAILPRRWRSTLFQHGAAESTRNVCASMIAEAFTAVNYPILPVARHLDDGSVRLYRRNTRLFAPRDFDYSPYFDIIKFPYLSFDEVEAYRALPWDADGQVYDETFPPQPPE
jgi:hypothetical protein